jgi:uncharacterized membrane protein SpoIIM required for sporulation
MIVETASQIRNNMNHIEKIIFILFIVLIFIITFLVKFYNNLLKSSYHKDDSPDLEEEMRDFKPESPNPVIIGDS